jgi:hypothetical protein
VRVPALAVDARLRPLHPADAAPSTSRVRVPARSVRVYRVE